MPRLARFFFAASMVVAAAGCPGPEVVPPGVDSGPPGIDSGPFDAPGADVPRADAPPDDVPVPDAPIGIDVPTSCADPDVDGDGADSMACGGLDCDDGDPGRAPGRPEICDALDEDEDCDLSTYGLRDGDGDGYADSRCCNLDAGVRTCGPDCDDGDAASHPSEAESCDGRDNDCDGAIDESALVTFYRDLDGDGFGVAAMPRTGCSLLTGYAFVPGDCNDMATSVHPGATESCNGVDDDCDGANDPGCMCTVGATRPCGTSDGMGGFLTVGVCRAGTQDCLTGAWSMACAGGVAPSAESCNAADDDCDGRLDEGVTNTFYRDVDGDGFGNPAATMQACSAPVGYVFGAGDCDDTVRTVYMGAGETCNGRDEDCDAVIDEGEFTTFYADADGDGYGNPSVTTLACTPPAGFVADMRDCNDGTAAVRPGAMDGAPDCNMIDDNCDGSVDPGCTCPSGMTRPCGTTDGMGGYSRVGVCQPGTETCTGGAWGTCMGSVMSSPESCNLLDDDCDGVVDDDVMMEFYRDCDGDGFGATGSIPQLGCTAPAVPPSCGTGAARWVANDTDCNDMDTMTRPGAPERCNRLYDNCSNGSGVNVSEDFDNDGRAPTSNPCTGGTLPKTDCCDTDNRAYAGAGGEFSTPRTGCGGFDFNCDGTETPSIGVATCTSSGDCGAASTCGMAGFATATACGVSAPYDICFDFDFSCVSPVRTRCVTTTSDPQTQLCR